MGFRDSLLEKWKGQSSTAGQKWVRGGWLEATLYRAANLTTYYHYICKFPVMSVLGLKTAAWLATKVLEELL